MGIRLALTAFVVSVVGAGVARATTVFIRFDPGYSTLVTVDRTVNGGANWYMQDPGQFHFLTQPGSPADVPLSFYTFCIEPREFLTPGQFVSYDLVPVEQGATNIGGMGATKANVVRELLGRYYPDFSIEVDDRTGAAIQVALWEIIRENVQTIGSYDLATGDVRYRTWSDPAVETLATTMLSSLTGTGPMVSVSGVQALTLVGTQDTLVQLTTGGFGSTPEPATLFLMGAGLVAVGLLGRRKKA